MLKGKNASNLRVARIGNFTSRPQPRGCKAGYVTKLSLAEEEGREYAVIKHCARLSGQSPLETHSTAHAS